MARFKALFSTTPTTVTKREYVVTLVSISAILLFIAIIVTINLYRSTPPVTETYIFPNNTYVCSNDTETKEHIVRKCVPNNAAPDNPATVTTTVTVTTN